MARKIKAPTGTADMLPDAHDFVTFVKKVVRHRFRQAGFRRIEVPIFEETELFERSLGVDSEIIKREVYSFTDPRGRDFSLRPEMTSGVVRAFLEHKMYEGPLPVELYYIGRCFRFERPKSRTQREFWQFGGEIIGESDPAIDAQIIYLGHRILADLGIRDRCDLKINTIGSVEDREKYIDALANFYAGKERSLSPHGREKLEQKKYLDLLNPRTEDEEVLAKMAPKITDFLSAPSQEFFDQMLSYLNAFGIPYTIDPTLVRPLQYYSQTTFEFRKTDSREKILVGGRYDGLGKKMGHEKVLGGCGFAAGMERTIALMKEGGIAVPQKDILQIFVAATGVVAKKHALPILVKLREHGFHAVGVLGKTSMEEQLNRAQKFHVPYTILMGDLEIKKNEVIVRNMQSGKSETISADDIVPHMEKLLGGQKALDTTDDFLPKKQ
ncbi:MAG: histidine--tRNA ligase [Candidatus Gracilibacteria bacterium]|nr:histidine--tRNA ligase [Candidatus Gracilibacteria bacterium]